MNEVKKLQLYMNLQRFIKKQKILQKLLKSFRKDLCFFLITLSLIIEETNIYLAKGQTDKAQNNLMKAVEKDPKNPNSVFCHRKLIMIKYIMILQKLYRKE